MNVASRLTSHQIRQAINTKLLRHLVSAATIKRPEQMKCYTFDHIPCVESSAIERLSANVHMIHTIHTLRERAHMLN